VSQKATPFELPTGEGAPQGLRGWGVRLGGLGKSSPVGLGKAQGLAFSVADHMKLCVQSVVCYTSLNLLDFRKGA
jgi:hypothetical protein